MEAKIKEVQKYFRDQILAGNFKLVEYSGYVIILRVDEIYDFYIWIGNIELPNTRYQYRSEFSFMNLDFSDDDILRLHYLLYDRAKAIYIKMLKQEKEKAILALQSEIDQIG